MLARCWLINHLGLFDADCEAINCYHMSQILDLHLFASSRLLENPLPCHQQRGTRLEPLSPPWSQKSLSRENQADVIEAFNLTSRYLDDLLNIDNIYFDQMVDRIYPTELQLNRANSSDTEAPFLDLNLCISNGTVSTKIYDKRDDFDFDIVSFPFLDGDVPRRTSYGVYISQLIRFARASSNLNDFN